MSAGPLLNQEKARRLLHRALAREELPPAYLFIGPHGVGKEEAALDLAKALNCREREEIDSDLFIETGSISPEAKLRFRELGGCGNCSSCTRIGNYRHPDLIVRLPLPRPPRKKRNEPADPNEALSFKAENPYRDPINSGGALSIGIADIREIIRQLAFAPVEGGKRVVVLREADMMTEEAQNALLKSLEETPPHTLFILTTHRPYFMQPTVRSRSHAVFFSPLDPVTIANYLTEKGIAREDELNVAHLARGNIKRAIEIAESGIPGREEAIRLLLLAVEGRRRETLAWANGYTFRSGGTTLAEARKVMEELLSLTRDVAVIQNGENANLLNPDWADMLNDVGYRAPEGAGLRALEAVTDACGEVDSNVNLALIYTTLFDALAPLGANLTNKYPSGVRSLDRMFSES